MTVRSCRPIHARELAMVGISTPLFHLCCLVDYVLSIRIILILRDNIEIWVLTFFCLFLC